MSNVTKLNISKSKKGVMHTDKTKSKMSISHTGKAMKPHTDETKMKISLAALNRPKKICEYCNREFTVSLFLRYHGDKCRMKGLIIL